MSTRQKKSRFFNEIPGFWNGNGLQLVFSGPERKLVEIYLYRKLESVTVAKQGITSVAAQQKAASMAADKMSTLAALHNPDMIAGGKDAVTSMGDRGVNSSIGAQWKDRVGEMDKAAREVPEAERANTKMNTKLKRCK